MFCQNLSRGPLKILTRRLIFLTILQVSCAIKDLDVEDEALLDLLHFLNDSNKQITDWDSFLLSLCFSWSHVTFRNSHVISLCKFWENNMELQDLKEQLKELVALLQQSEAQRKELVKEQNIKEQAVVITLNTPALWRWESAVWGCCFIFFLLVTRYFDMTQQPPWQELVATNLHGNEWHFRHIFRGVKMESCELELGGS